MAATTVTAPPPTPIKLISAAFSHSKSASSFLPSPPKPSPFLRLSICTSSHPLLRLPFKNPPFFFSSFAAQSSSAWAPQQEVELTEEGEQGDFLESGEEEAFVEPLEEAKLFVGNLSYDVDSQGLAELFQRAGTVEIAEVIYNRETDQSHGFGFITMSIVEEADKAIELFNRYDMNGRVLSVNKAAPRGARLERTPRAFEPSFRIYVGNLSWQVDDARLEQVFSEHGKVVDVRVVYDRDSGRSQGFGFVTMASEKEMGDAITALDGQNLDGRATRVNVAEERPRRGGF